MNEMLLIIAEGTLRDFPARLWDSAGFKVYEVAAQRISQDPSEILAAWKGAIDKQHTAWTSRYRDYRKAGGQFADSSDTEDLERKEKVYVNDMKVWNLAPIVKLEAFGGTLKFLLADGVTFEMPIEDIYSQISFRKAYSLGTAKVLPAIKNASYEQFIGTLKPVKIEDEGLSIQERIQECLAKQWRKRRNDGMDVIETIADAASIALERGWAVFGEEIYFTLEALLTELRREHYSMNRASLVSALYDVDAERERTKEGRYWFMRVGGDDSQLPL